MTSQNLRLYTKSLSKMNKVFVEFKEWSVWPNSGHLMARFNTYIVEHASEMDFYIISIPLEKVLRWNQNDTCALFSTTILIQPHGHVTPIATQQ